MTPYYDEDGITIYHGDALEVLPALPQTQMVVTDPPYFQPATHYVPARGTQEIRSLGDTSILLLAFRTWAATIRNAITETAPLYIFCDGQSYPITYQSFYALGRVRPLVWDKMRSFNGYTWRHQHELVAWVERYGSPKIPTGDGDVIPMRAVPVGQRLHPAQKPVDLLRAIIRKHDADIILDPFAGSGSTLVAAALEDRQAIGVEVDERYCEIAARRLSQGVLDIGA